MVAKPRRADRPTVFREPGALLYAGNCKDLLDASLDGKVTLSAWTRRGYPGRDLGDALPQVCSVGGWDATRPQDWGLKLHCNEGVKIAYLQRGTLTLVLDGEKHVLTAGQMFVVRPWQLHAMGDPHVEPSQIVWTLFDMGTRRPHDQWQWPDWLAWPERDRDSLTRFLSRNEQPFYQASKGVAQAFEDIAAIVAGNQIERDELKLRLAISMMMLQFKLQLETEGPVLDSALAESRRTVAIFLDRLKLALGEKWTLENMAAECNLSRTRFTEHCLALTNTSPVRYLQALRLDGARNLLEREPDMSVTEVAYECGFSSSQYFSTSFRKRFGMSPQATRRETPAILRHVHQDMASIAA